MKLRALVFDVDGTLADTEEAHRLAFNSAFEALGLPWHWDANEYRRLLEVTGGKERLLAYINQLPGDRAEREAFRAQVPEIHREKTRAYEKRVARGVVALRPGVARLVSEARSGGLRLAIATTTSRANIEALVYSQWRAGLDRVFDVVACGDEVKVKKPAPDIYHLALSRLGLEAGHCIAFEDSAAGVASAKDAGLYCVAAPSRWTAHHDLSRADRLVASLDDFRIEALDRAA